MFKKFNVLLKKKKMIYVRPFSQCHSTCSSDELPTLRGLPELVSVPALDEIKNAIKSIRNKMSPGDDGIPGEVYKYGGPQIASYLHSFFDLCWTPVLDTCVGHLCWTSGMILKRWKHGNIISIYKKKCDHSICGNG